MNDITPTPQRAKQYNYSEPYIQSHYVLIMKDNANFTSIKDVKGKKVAAGTGTDNEKIAKKFGAKTVPAADFASGLDLVRQGRSKPKLTRRKLGAFMLRSMTPRLKDDWHFWRSKASPNFSDV